MNLTIPVLRSCVLGLLAACATLLAHARDPLRVVASTGMVADLVTRVGGPEVSVQVLLGPGADPHLFSPRPNDLLALQRAELIVTNGLRLEGKMGDALERLQRSRRVHSVGETLPQDRIREEEAGVPDPHAWFDVALWAEGAAPLAETLAELRPAQANAFRARAATARADLLALDAWVREQLAAVPAERRILVTSHDAFGYFGAAYDFRVIGLQGLSTAAEAGLADVSRLITFLRENRVPAVFVETSVNPQGLRRVADEAGVRIGGSLFSDALGAPDPARGADDPGTYAGMVRHNVRTLVDVLVP